LHGRYDRRNERESSKNEGKKYNNVVDAGRVNCVKRYFSLLIVFKTSKKLKLTSANLLDVVSSV